ncbi:uncharacterized protein LOC110931475 [Helianthus annuus]|uniref:uncharacterized protein LOC110931475 n=1 Tax=Helianthus annuus TaxID=4232 RepID=UPI000B8FC274|nr:uncharacterized protein LOC110931475 [Helianthus annuus]
MDPSWVSPQFTFSGFQQSPNAFKQMSQVQQMQQYQALQQFMQHNSFEQFQSQPPTSQPQPPVQLDDDDEDVVPKSPPKELKRKKEHGEGEGDLGNNQTGTSFWKATTERFNGIMGAGPMRDLDSVSGKWRKMNKTINEFCGYYNQIYTNLPSWSNDEDILNLALAKWDSKNSTPFPHLRAWNVLKKENKWKPVPNEVATVKQSKNSESGSYSAGGSTARCQIDINDDPIYDEDVLPVHEVERPPGKDKSKKEAAGKRKGGGSGGGGGFENGRVDNRIPFVQRARGRKI